MLATFGAAFSSQDPANSITAGNPAPGVTAAIQALARNNFCTFLGTANKSANAKFNKDFVENNKPDFHTTMLIKEAYYPRDSPNGMKHGYNYDLVLVTTLMYVECVNLAKYREILKQHTDTQRSKAPNRQPQGEEDNSNASPAKRFKAIALSLSFAKTFYHTFLGKIESTSADGSTIMWRPKENLHRVLGEAITAASSIFDT